MNRSHLTDRRRSCRDVSKLARPLNNAIAILFRPIYEEKYHLFAQQIIHGMIQSLLHDTQADVSWKNGMHRYNRNLLGIFL
jgi:hypothetical protein